MEKGRLFEYLQERGLIYQTTNDDKVKELINGEPIAIYCGIDPTADSLHIGHTFSLFMLRRFQQAGHKIIVLLGGATAKIGDPSGRNDMRNMVTNEFIQNNYENIKSIIGRFVKLDGENPATIVNNADWMNGYDYVSFMRDIGSNFNVKHMLQNDSCVSRLNAGGLTFFEMGYMLIQAYDFVYLNRNYGCKLQIGGSDQWGNIIAGVELGRKLNFQEGKDEEGYQALVTPLLTNSEGKKMGKTAKGAVWLDPNKTTPFEFYQYWRNVDDADVMKCIKMLTFIPMDKIKEMEAWEDNRINEKKEVLAYELTALVHGEEEAIKAQTSAKALFSGCGDDENMPTTTIPAEEIGDGIFIADLMVKCNLCTSKGEAKRLIQQGGVSVNDEVVKDLGSNYKLADFEAGVKIRKGKKVFHKAILG